MDALYGRAPPESRKTDWARSQLLVPRRERGLKPLVSQDGDIDDEEEEERIVREAEAANARLLASGMDRCPTGRLPGLGTVKSEHVLIKQRQAEARAEALRRREMAEKGFVQWLKRKQEQGQILAPQAAAQEEEKQAQEQAKRAERRRLADERFNEWRMAKDQQRREQRKKEREARADALASIMAAVSPGNSQANASPGPSSLNSPKCLMSPIDEPREQTRGTPHSNQRAKSPLGRLKAADMKWARVYLDKALPRPPGGAALVGSDVGSPQDGERTLLRRCLQRFTRWLSKPQHRVNLEDSLRRADHVGNSQLDEETTMSLLRECGFKVDAYESRLLFRHISTKYHGQCERLITRLNAKREARAASQRESNLRRSPSPRKRRPRHASAARRKAAARRIMQALNGDTGSDLEDILEHAAENAAEALANATDLRSRLDNFLATSEKHHMSELLDKDLTMLCSSFMEDETADHPRSVSGLLFFVREMAQDSGNRNLAGEAQGPGEEASLEVKISENVREPLREFFRSMGSIPTCARVREALTLCHESSTIEGTVLVEILAAHGEDFTRGFDDANEQVTERSFVDYFADKYDQYQKESMAIQSPSMRPRSSRPRTSRNRSRKTGGGRGGDNGGAKRRAGTSPSRIRVVRPPRHQLEAKAERERLTRATYTSGEEDLVEVRPKPSPAYVAFQTLHERAKAAARSLGSVTSAQVAEVLNLERPPQDVMRTIGGACLLVGVAPTWKHARGLFRHWPNFLAFASSVTTTHVPKFDAATLLRLRAAAAPLPVPGAPAAAPLPRLALVLHRWVAAMLAVLESARDAPAASPS